MLDTEGTKKPITWAFFLPARNRVHQARSEEEEPTDRHERAKTADKAAGYSMTTRKYDHTGEDGTPVRASPRRETVYRPQPVCSVSNTAH